MLSNTHAQNTAEVRQSFFSGPGSRMGLPSWSEHFGTASTQQPDIAAAARNAALVVVALGPHWGPAFFDFVKHFTIGLLALGPLFSFDKAAHYAA